MTPFTRQRERLLRSIERDQDEVRLAVHKLAGRSYVKQNVLEHLKAHPWPWLLGAVVLGALLGARPDRPLNAGRGGG